MKFVEFTVRVTQKDIDGGVSCRADLCMHKIAIARALDQIDKAKAYHHKVRVDAGHIKFNMNGYRYKAETPKIARRTLFHYDNKRTRHLVRPHTYRVRAMQTTKIVRMPPERQDQINEARRKRIAAGGTETQRVYTLRDRIVGYDLGHGG